MDEGEDEAPIRAQERDPSAGGVAEVAVAAAAHHRELSGADGAAGGAVATPIAVEGAVRAVVGVAAAAAPLSSSNNRSAMPTSRIKIPRTNWPAGQPDSNRPPLSLPLIVR